MRFNEVMDGGCGDEFRVYIPPGEGRPWRDVAGFVVRSLGLVPVTPDAAVNRRFEDIETLDDCTDCCDFAIIILASNEEPSSRRKAAQEIIFCREKFGEGNVLVLQEDGAGDLPVIPGIHPVQYAGGAVQDAFDEIRDRLNDAMNRYELVYVSEDEL
jgi:hypothetical protein